jgi:hypothetical protein
VVVVPPFQLMFWKVEVLLPWNWAEVLAIMVKVPVVDAGVPKMTDWEVLPFWLLLVMVRLLNALIPVMVPDAVCCVVPLSIIVPAPAVYVPLLV